MTATYNDFLYESFSAEHPSTNLTNLFSVLASVIGGFFLAATFVAQLIEYRKDINTDEDSLEDSLEDEENDLANNYYEELNALEEREMTKTELDALQFTFVDVETPDGLVKMTYNNSTESFWYYTNTKNVQYKYLDAVARLFTIEYKCRQICVNYKEEYEKGVITLKEKMTEQTKRTEMLEQLMEETKKSVFAKFKKYKQADDTKQKYYVLTDRANVFKYAGNLADYELSKKAKLIEIPKMDYATFKQRGVLPPLNPQVKNVGV